MRGRGCSACPGGVSWGSDRQPWQIAWPSKTTVPCPPALNPKTTVLPAGMPAPRLPAHAPASRRRTRCPFHAKLSGCELRRLGHTSCSAASPTLGTASHRGEGAPGEAATLPRIQPGSTLEVFFVVRLYTSPLTFISPSTARRAAVTLARHCVSLKVYRVPTSPVVGSHQNLWQTGNCSKTPSMSNGVTDGASNGLPPQQGAHPWIFLHFPNPSRSPIPEAGNGGEIQMAGKGQVY